MSDEHTEPEPEDNDEFGRILDRMIEECMARGMTQREIMAEIGARLYRGTQPQNMQEHAGLDQFKAWADDATIHPDVPLRED